MNTKIKYLLASLPFLLNSCDSTRVIDEPIFTITADSAEYSVGSTTTFQIIGQPDIMTFYSGEIGHEYRNKDRVVAEGGRTLLTFNSNLVSAQSNLSLIASTDLDFTGAANHADSVALIQNATWIDLHPKLPVTATSSTSGKGNFFSDTVTLNSAHKYIAFKYVGSSTIQPIWTIKNINIQNRLSSKVSFKVMDSTVVNYNMTVFTTSLSVATIKTSTAKILTITGMPIVGGDKTNEIFIFINNINFIKAQPDMGINMGLKTYINSIYSFPYIYTTPGTYKATFVGRNVTNVGDLSKVVEIGVNVK